MDRPAYETYQRLPEIILARHLGRNQQDEDLLQEGRLELWRCIREQDAAHTNFFNYAYTRILHRYLRLTRQRKQERGETTGLDEASAMEAGDPLEWVELRENIARTLRRRPQQAAAVQMKLLGMSYRRIGAALGVAPATARRLCWKGAVRLRQQEVL